MKSWAMEILEESIDEVSKQKKLSIQDTTAINNLNEINTGYLNNGKDGFSESPSTGVQLAMNGNIKNDINNYETIIIPETDYDEADTLGLLLEYMNPGTTYDRVTKEWIVPDEVRERIHNEANHLRTK